MENLQGAINHLFMNKVVLKGHMFHSGVINWISTGVDGASIIIIMKGGMETSNTQFL